MSAPDLMAPTHVLYSVIIQKGRQMEATVVDLRYRMNDVLKALERNESVSVLCRGKLKGIIRPAVNTTSRKVREHVFFGSRTSDEPMEKTMRRLRERRYHAL